MECHGKLENFHQVRMEWNWRKLSSQLYHVLFLHPTQKQWWSWTKTKTQRQNTFFPTCQMRILTKVQLLLLIRLLRYLVDLSSSSFPLPAPDNVVHVWTRTPYRELWMQWATPGPKHMPKRMPHRMPDRMSEYMPDRMPERLPVRMSEHMYDRMPESMPIYAR